MKSLLKLALRWLKNNVVAELLKQEIEHELVVSNGIVYSRVYVQGILVHEKQRRIL